MRLMEELGYFFAFLARCKQGLSGKLRNNFTFEDLPFCLARTKILNLFFKSDAPDLTLREIEAKTEILPKMVRFQVAWLTKLGLLEEIRIGRLISYRLRSKNKKVQDLRRVFNGWGTETIQLKNKEELC